MPENFRVSENKRYAWDDVAEGLTISGTIELEDESMKHGESWRRQSASDRKSKIYCPHRYLILNFHESMNPSQKIDFRKHYLRKASPSTSSGQANVVILQDVKDLVMYLVTSPMTRQFINFFHLPLVDRFLRSLILYYQYYVDVWEEMMEKRSATTRKAANPLAGGAAGRLRRAEEMRILRCVVGREYSELLLGSAAANTDGQTHRRTIIKNRRGKSTVPGSQGENDLGIFEPLIVMAHRVVWIALRRQYYNLIEIEMHRLFRTDAYNTANRQIDRGNDPADTALLDDRSMIDDELAILQGSSRMQPIKRKLLANSSLPFQIIYQECDYRLLSLGIIATRSKDPRIMYLENALLADEERFAELGIKVGILGQPRDDYDIMLVRMDSEEFIQGEEQPEDSKEKWEKRKSSLAERILKKLQPDRTGTRMPSYGSNLETLNVFPMEIIDAKYRGHNEDRERARKKWIAREFRRISEKYTDTSSIVATLE